MKIEKVLALAGPAVKAEWESQEGEPVYDITFRPLDGAGSFAAISIGPDGNVQKFGLLQVEGNQAYLRDLKASRAKLV